jgi:DNA-binding response OmpR family regulator
MMTATILIVDDEDLTRKLLHHCLTRAGYDVIQAHNGQEALSLIDSICPRLIILDVLMPKMNGFDTVRQMRTDGPCKHTPIIFLSSRADTAAEVEGLGAGAQLYLLKPFRVEELLFQVEMLLRDAAPITTIG